MITVLQSYFVFHDFNIFEEYRLVSMSFSFGLSDVSS